MVAVHILIFCGVAGFKIVPFIATHVKKKKKIFMEMKKKKKKKNQNSPICMKTTDIKLFLSLMLNIVVCINSLNYSIVKN